MRFSSLFSVQTRITVWEMVVSILVVVIPLALAVLWIGSRFTCARWAHQFCRGAEWGAGSNLAFVVTSVTAFLLLMMLYYYYYPEEEDTIPSSHVALVTTIQMILFSPLAVPFLTTLAFLVVYTPTAFLAFWFRNFFYLGALSMNILLQGIWNLVGWLSDCDSSYHNNNKFSPDFFTKQEPRITGNIWFLVFLGVSALALCALPRLLFYTRSCCPSRTLILVVEAFLFGAEDDNVEELESKLLGCNSAAADELLLYYKDQAQLSDCI